MVSVATVAALFALSSEPAKPFFDKPMLLGAHRGGMVEWPENTLFGFTSCANRWPDILLETDVRQTKDGRLILLHDDTVDRTTDGKGRPSEMTFEELRRLDAGYRFTSDQGATYPFRGKGHVIPTLDEALAATPRHRWLIDIKPDCDAAAVVRVVREQKAEQRVLIASFVPAKMAEVRRLAPDLATCYDYTTGLPLFAAIRSGALDDYVRKDDVVSMMVEDVKRFSLSPEDVRAVRSLGIKFQIHTLNRSEEIRHWLAIGVDSILTDDPALLAREIEAWQRSAD
ncbi:MAG: glycerophosphodiester phosphodiesterase family protein [Fimbriimonadaceae bacterium]